MLLDRLFTTTNSRVAGLVRVLLGIIFLMTGLMKLLVPRLSEAWSGQLLAANIPLYTVSRWSVPFVELALGIALLLGFFARGAVVIAIVIMVVATYVHLEVDDPSLFPLQPTEPVVPLLVVLLSVYILWRGAGAWSIDLKNQRPAARQWNERHAP
jgi:uncharacterized membrane protein YphA (DoxX/SURF4 family)